jgi:hypothetical protein
VTASDLTTIRQALADTVRQLDLSVYPEVPDVIQGPAVVVDFARDPSISFTGAMRMGGDEYYFDLLLLVPIGSDVTNAQKILDQYVTGQGTKSVREFLFNNSSLGLPDVDCVAKSVRGYGGGPQSASTRMIGAIMRVCVTVT